MKARPPAMLSALAALLAALGPRGASAAERACPTAAVQADASVRARFPDLLERIQNELLARSDIDACARVTLRVESEAAFGVSVALPDGRSAARNAVRAEDVVPTLQALLLVPAPVPASAPLAVPQPAPSAPAIRRSARPAAVARSEVVNGDLSSSPATVPRQFGFELSVISGVRFGDGQFGYGAGMLSFLQVSRWLIGFQGRADGYRSIVYGDPETALELALLAGRRFDLGGTALDLTAGPAIAMKGAAFSNTESEAVNGMPGPTMAPPPPRSEPSSRPVPRLLVGARLGFSPRSLLRTFVGIDGELGPTHTVDSASASSSSRMPTYTVGFALGATVGTP
jgi:hypothetical protein